MAEDVKVEVSKYINLCVYIRTGVSPGGGLAPRPACAG